MLAWRAVLANATMNPEVAFARVGVVYVFTSKEAYAYGFSSEKHGFK